MDVKPSNSCMHCVWGRHNAAKSLACAKWEFRSADWHAKETRAVRAGSVDIVNSVEAYSRSANEELEDAEKALEAATARRDRAQKNAENARQLLHQATCLATDADDANHTAFCKASDAGRRYLGTALFPVGMPHLNGKDITCRRESVKKTVLGAENVTGNSYLIVTAPPRTREAATSRPIKTHKSKRRQNQRVEPYPTSRERVRERTEDSIKDEEPNDSDIKGQRTAKRQLSRRKEDTSTIPNNKQASQIKVEADASSLMDKGEFQVVKSEAVEPSFAPSSRPTRRSRRKSGPLVKREEE